MGQKPNYNIGRKPSKRTRSSMDIESLKGAAQAYASHRDLKLSTIGAYAVNDGKFFYRLAKGGGCTLRTANRLLTFLAINWPEDLEWPSDIPRPQLQRQGRAA